MAGFKGTTITTQYPFTGLGGFNLRTVGPTGAMAQ
jgi:hypothetical protein